jgi:hypothetical protein
VPRRCRGTYWGEAGFVRVERGVNALQIESGDCWCGPLTIDRQAPAGRTQLRSLRAACPRSTALAHGPCTAALYSRRYAEPEWRDEQDVHAGTLHGSMYGLKVRKPRRSHAAGSSLFCLPACRGVRHVTPAAPRQRVARQDDDASAAPLLDLGTDRPAIARGEALSQARKAADARAAGLGAGAGAGVLTRSGQQVDAVGGASASRRLVR